MKSIAAITLVLQLASAAIVQPLSDPHFPTHQLSTSAKTPPRGKHAALTLFDNAPVTPTPETPPAHALASSIPLESTYLQSLANPATHPPSRDPLGNPASGGKFLKSTSALPARPTSALAVLRKEDDMRYWATHAGSQRSSDHEAEEASAAVSFSSGILRAVRICPEHPGITSKRYGGGPLTMAREYSDVLVVGMVLVFLVLVVVLEAREKCGGVTRLGRNRGGRRGQIYLSDDDDEARHVRRKPTYLQPAPEGRYQSRWGRRTAPHDGDSGSETAIKDALFEYDETAYGKV